jgi:hypothetical protein
MSPNLLTAIKNIAEFKNNDLKGYFGTYPIRINQVGEQLECFIKDAFCGCFQSNKDPLIHSRGTFSYSGNQNNGPDIILTNGDAFEIKKIQGLKASLALNNSPPKDRLHRDDARITDECRRIDGANWVTKDIFYVVGVVERSRIKHLFFVHGLCYAADRSVYENKASRLKQGIDIFFKNEGWHTTTTNELGRINRMDPLGITNFRIRGMWEIENPLRVFSYTYEANERRDFSLAAILTKPKYDSFDEHDRIALESTAAIKSRTIDVKNPNNPAQLMQAQLITLAW